MQAYNISCSISTPALLPASTTTSSASAASAAPVLVSVDLAGTGVSVSGVQTTSIDLAAISASNKDPPLIALEVRMHARSIRPCPCASEQRGSVRLCFGGGGGLQERMGREAPKLTPKLQHVHLCRYMYM